MASVDSRRRRGRAAGLAAWLARGGTQSLNGCTETTDLETLTTRDSEVDLMAKLLIRLLVSALAVYAAQWISRALVINGIIARELVTVDDFLAALVFAIVLGILNALVRPILLLLTCPINILTLGLFVLVVNAVVFELAAFLVGSVHVDGFLGAFLGSLVVTVCSTIADQLLEGSKDG
jgi:putative membrane protein